MTCRGPAKKEEEKVKAHQHFTVGLLSCSTFKIVLKYLSNRTGGRLIIMLLKHSCLIVLHTLSITVYAVGQGLYDWISKLPRIQLKILYEISYIRVDLEVV